MDLMKAFAAASQEFAEFRQMLEDAKSQPMDHEVREYLDDIIRSLDENFAQARTLVPQASEEIQQIEAEAKASNEATLKKLEGIKAQLSALEKEQASSEAAAASKTAAAAGKVAVAAGVVATAAAAIDTALGGRLRNEVLSQFGLKTAAPQTAPADPGSVWEMSSGFEEPTPKPASAKPSPPENPKPPSAKPKKRSSSSDSSEAWEGLSELGDE